MKVIAENRRARFDFEILETVEAGIMLTGPEVKSCREGHVNLAGAYVSFHNGEAVLKNASISPYSFAARMPHEERRDRKMLLKAAELKKLTTRAEEKGFTVVPLSLRVGRFVKVELGIGRGRKKTDKRQHIREREVARKLKQTGDY
ncbi:MAG: SsrA-binding protein SmpB [Candidatus Peribacter sp.]|nr:SsrA-binding protein SmpB [Candidatus Peribacter sp.]